MSGVWLVGSDRLSENQDASKRRREMIGSVRRQAQDARLRGFQKAAAAEVPRQLGHVTLVERVGEGGMGVVWRGRDKFLKRDVAVKLFRHLRLARDPELRRQFIDGARAAAVIKHANVVSIYHADELNEVIYIVMEYVDGCTLQDVLADRSALEPPLAALVIGKVLGALAAIHDAQVIHRDLKPANVMFDRKGKLLVSDFGLSYQRESARTGDAPVLGTPPYMAPETFDGEGSFQSDVYAVGIMYYELLTGARPFRAESVVDYHFQHENVPIPAGPIDRLGLSDDMHEVIIRATNKKKIFRYKSAAHMLKALTDAHAGLLKDHALDLRLRDLVRGVGRSGSGDSTAHHATESPAATYFDLLSQRADAKRKRKEEDSGELQ
ncbi:MAG: serine/threonine-protein kinase [Planctomycetota bacterium]|nr:serine/threonine-protein kinase [Planctomycetota bacterium]